MMAVEHQKQHGFWKREGPNETSKKSGKKYTANKNWLRLIKT